MWLEGDLDTVYLIGGKSNPLVVSKLESNRESLRVILLHVIRTAADEDVLVVVNPLDDLVVALLGHVLSYTSLLLAYTPGLENRVKSAEPDRNGSGVEESLSLLLEVRSLLGIHHVELESTLWVLAPGEGLATNTVGNGLTQDVVKLPRNDWVLIVVPDGGSPSVVGNDIVLIDGVLDVVVSKLVELETPELGKNVLEAVTPSLVVVLIVFAILISPLKVHGQVEHEVR